MSETIVTKRCCTCKQIKPFSEFNKARREKDGFQPQCITCKREYQQQYRKTEKGKIAQKRGQKCYQQSDKCKTANKKSGVRFSNRHPNQRKATRAVSSAIRAGKIPRPDTFKCSCGELAQHYHHNLGYAPEHWLDVIPVCIECHKKVHLVRQSASNGFSPL